MSSRLQQAGLVLPAGLLRLAIGRYMWAGIAAALKKEADSFDSALIVPIMMMIGVIIYFSAPEEPGLIIPLIMMILMFTLAWFIRMRGWTHVLAICLASISLGFCSAKIRTGLVAAPQIQRSVAANVTGLVISVDARLNDSARIILRPVKIEGLDNAAMPSRIRLTLRKAGPLMAGDAITVKALLRPPSPPVLPGGYDFARHAYFDGIGAVGFAAGAYHFTQNITPSYNEEFAIWIDNLRNALTERIVEAIPGENGALAASQVTGKRGRIPEEANDALRASGLYHVVSISGLHMALFAGGLFWLVRAFLALSPRIVLFFNAKRIAAMVCLGPAAAYTVFSGAEVATVRSFIMTALVLASVMLERQALTRRNVALAATLVLLTTPEELLGPSFQMSFAAVAMLVAGAEAWNRRGANTHMTRWERFIAGGLRLIIGMGVTTLIASVATAPFSAFHFHRVTLQSVVSNLLATPLVSFLIMPLALIAVIAEPFGYGLPFWELLGVVVGWFMQIARSVAAWPGSDIIMPQYPPSVLLCFCLALVILTISCTRLAALASIPVAIGVGVAAMTPGPIAIVGANGYAALVRNGTDTTILARGGDRFTVKQWLLAIGDRRLPDDPSLQSFRQCDPEGCSAPLEGGGVFMLDRTANAVEEDCEHAAILAASVVVSRPCKGLVIDRDTIRAAGAVAIYHNNSTSQDPALRWRVVPARNPDVSRPWAPSQTRAKVHAAPPLPVKVDDEEEPAGADQ